MVHTFAVYLEDRPGALNRVASLFRRRAFNIESLTVGRTENRGVSRMTVVVDTDAYGAQRLEAHLYKLVPVRRVDDITTAPAIARDLALIKVAANAEVRAHVMRLVEVYRARIVDVSTESLVVEATGTEDKIDSLLEVLRPYGVIEMVRTGRVAMARGTVPRRQRSSPHGTVRSAEQLREEAVDAGSAGRRAAGRLASDVHGAAVSPSEATTQATDCPV